MYFMSPTATFVAELVLGKMKMKQRIKVSARANFYKSEKMKFQAIGNDQKQKHFNKNVWRRPGV